MLENIDLHDGEPAPPPRITAPLVALSNLNLQDELALQYNKAKNLYSEVEDDEATPANQKAQVLNSISSIITLITKSQGELYNMKRFQAAEEALIKALKSLPEEAQALFYVEYEANLAQITV